MYIHIVHVEICMYICKNTDFMLCELAYAVDMFQFGSVWGHPEEDE